MDGVDAVLRDRLNGTLEVATDLREETLRAAITALIHFHQSLPLTEAFGEGTTTSSPTVCASASPPRR